MCRSHWIFYHFRSPEECKTSNTSIRMSITNKAPSGLTVHLQWCHSMAVHLQWCHKNKASAIYSYDKNLLATYVYSFTRNASFRSDFKLLSAKFKVICALFMKPLLSGNYRTYFVLNLFQNKKEFRNRFVIKFFPIRSDNIILRSVFHCMENIQNRR